MSENSQAKPLNLGQLKSAVAANAAAFRCRRRLQPGGGAGDKVFPPTYAGAVYAVEQRRVAGREEPVTCVLLDSVQSQANRMEQALQEALSLKELTLPVIEVDFSPHAPTGKLDEDEKAGRLLDAIGKLTSLQVPHRLADAILRDSEIAEGEGAQKKTVPFRKSQYGNALNTASPLNATPIYELCPTALLFGMWDSTGPKGGLGAKFERAIVSEVVGFGASFGVKTASRIDPLITKTTGIVLYQTSDDRWTLDPAEAKQNKNWGAVKLGATEKKNGDGKVSQANLGNVTPSFAKYTKGAEGSDPMKSAGFDFDYSVRTANDELNIRTHGQAGPPQEARQDQIAPGGVTLDYAEQLTTLSLIALRRLRFPVTKPAPDAAAAHAAGQTVLAALGLCAATLAFESGMGLRSRCLLWPEGAMEWELLAKPGETPRRFTLDSEGARKLLTEAVTAAEKAGLKWRSEPLTLQPSKNLLGLVVKSQNLTRGSGQAEEE